MNSRKEDQVSKDAALFLAASLGMFGMGLVGGIAYIFRQEKVKFNRHTHGRPAMVAARALLYGSILTVGTFGIGLGAFVKVSGITTIKEFGEVATNLCRPLYKAPTADDIAANDKELEDFEAFFGTGEASDNNNSSE